MDTYKFIDNELAVLTMEYSNRTWKVSISSYRQHKVYAEFDQVTCTTHISGTDLEDFLTKTFNTHNMKIVRTKLGDFAWKMKGGLFGNKMARFEMNQNLYWQILEVVLLKNKE